MSEGGKCQSSAASELVEPESKGFLLLPQFGFVPVVGEVDGRTGNVTFYGENGQPEVG